MTRRIAVNLVAFGALTVALAAWAIANVIELDFIERPYIVTAEFTTSPGLRPDVQATYLGHPIGEVRRVELVDDHVVVDLAIDRGTDLPAALDAAVRRQSAVGEPFVDLFPTSGTDPGGGARLAEGDVIPLARTTTPLDYSELFTAVDDLVSAIDPEATRVVTHELAAALAGRGDDLRTTFAGLTDLTTDLAARTDAIDALIDDLGLLTHTLADNSTSIGSTVDDLALLTSRLSTSGADLAGLLERGPTFIGVLADIVAASDGSLGCTLAGLAALPDALDQDAVASLDELIVLSPTFLEVLDGLRDDADGLARGTIDLANPTAPAATYSEPLAAPTPRPVPGCPDVESASPQADSLPSSNEPAASGSPTDDASVEVSPRPEQAAPTAPSAEIDTTQHEGRDLAAIVAGLLLVALSGLLWRLIKTRRLG